jgi:RNA polymerase sigma factor (sigma-70 family)
LSEESNHIISDSDLLSGCLAGDRRMQELLYKKFAPKMYAVCLRYSNTADDARDLLQDGFIKVYKNIAKFRGEGSFEGWIRRIFVNTAIEQFRKAVTLQTVTETHENTFEDREWNAFENLAEKDILAMIRELSPGYRQVFNMYVIEGYAHREIAEVMGISEGTSKSQLARAKTILQKMVLEKRKQ